MELTKEQIEELKANYELEESVILHYLNKILSELKIMGITNINEHTLYECLEYCCDLDSSNEFNKELLAQETGYTSFQKEEKYKQSILNENDIVTIAINEKFSEYFELRESSSIKM